jgi:ribosome recycling factor
MEQEVKKKTTEKMEGVVEHLRKELAGIRTGRASLALLDNIKVDYYGTLTPLRQVATLSVPESRLITIQPWEATLVPVIEKALLASDLGLTPAHDGKVIRLSIPSLTEERRKELVRLIHKHAEDARIGIRNHRRDTNEEFKRLQRDGKLSEDNLRKAQEEVQKLTDQYTHKIDEILKHKEEEILERR